MLVTLAITDSDVVSSISVALAMTVSDVTPAVVVVLEKDGSDVVSTAIVLFVVIGSGVVSTIEVVFVMTGSRVEMVVTSGSAVVAIGSVVLVFSVVQDNIVISQAYPEQQSGRPVAIPPPQASREPAQVGSVDEVTNGGSVVLVCSGVQDRIVRSHA